MLHPSTKRLIDKLGDMTRRQKVTWQEAEDGRMTHDTEGYRVTLTPEPYAVLLTDAQDREIETCSPSDFADDIDSDGRPYTLFVEELYREAKRHARGAEEAISAVLAGLDAVEIDAGDSPSELAEDAVEQNAEAVDVAAGEDTVEDPLDDSSPLEAEAYWEMDSQSDITSAVASLANQVNTPFPATPVDFETIDDISDDAAEPSTGTFGTQAMPSEDDILTDENTAVTLEEAVAESASGADIAEASEPVETETPTPPIMGYGISSPDAPAGLEPVDEAGPLDEPAAGFTPTGFVDTLPEEAPAAEQDSPHIEVEAETVAEPEAYAPAFSDIVADAPNYAQAEPFTTSSPEPEPEKAPNYLSSTSSAFTGALGGSLSSDNSEPNTPETELEPDTEETSAHSYAEDEASATEPRFETTPEPEPAPVPDPQPASPPSFSLSGIGARPEAAQPPAPMEANDPVESVGSPQVVIDATHDHAWPGTEPTGLNEDTPAPDLAFGTAEPQVEAEEDLSPEPDFVVEAQPEPAEAHAEDEEPVAAEEAPARPVKRFNPWN
tara:strand:+ start:4396 stop:6048 length:1653 start_codon:yes stop_codon:yes gene_type:complete